MLARYKLLLSLCICFVSTSASAGALDGAMAVAASGMRAQSERMKVVSQNIANADSTPTKPGEQPYRRKIISFGSEIDPASGAEVVTVDNISRDYKQAFKARYDPYHPAANAEGFVMLPNVKRDIEMLDMKEAERSYQANLGVIDTSKSMYMNTLDLLR